MTRVWCRLVWCLPSNLHTAISGTTLPHIAKASTGPCFSIISYQLDSCCGCDKLCFSLPTLKDPSSKLRSPFVKVPACCKLKNSTKERVTVEHRLSPALIGWEGAPVTGLSHTHCVYIISCAASSYCRGRQYPLELRDMKYCSQSDMTCCTRSNMVCCSLFVLPVRRLPDPPQQRQVLRSKLLPQDPWELPYQSGCLAWLQLNLFF